MFGSGAIPVTGYLLFFGLKPFIDAIFLDYPRGRKECGFSAQHPWDFNLTHVGVGAGIRNFADRYFDASLGS